MFLSILVKIEPSDSFVHLTSLFFRMSVGLTLFLVEFIKHI